MNQERAKRGGCPTLGEDSGLDSTAQQHSADMARTGDVQAGRPGENVARGPTSADQLVAQWMSSDSTRQNLLDCGITRAGVGLVTSGWYWTVDFGR
jgi:uncharacterized protein YkwD